MKPENNNIEKEFFSAYNANKRKNIDVAISQVAHYRGLTVEEVRTRLRHIIENLQAGNNLL